MSDYLQHHGILGMHWGIRRYQPYPKGERVTGGKEIGDATKVKQRTPLNQKRLESASKHQSKDVESLKKNGFNKEAEAVQKVKNKTDSKLKQLKDEMDFNNKSSYFKVKHILENPDTNFKLNKLDKNVISKNIKITEKRIKDLEKEYGGTWIASLSYDGSSHHYKQKGATRGPAFSKIQEQNKRILDLIDK